MADVTITGAIATDYARAQRVVVFTTDLIGYCIYVETAIRYRKTTDGGATWGTAVGIGSVPPIAMDVWYDRWTPGHTGTTIWITYFDATNDLVFLKSLDTTGDVLSVARTVFTGASAVAGRGAFVSITRARSGYLYCAYDLDAGAERGLHRSTDAGVNWSANLATTFVEATLDTCKLFPASGTGDDNDCWALYYDASALALTLKLWDSSAAAQVESATIGVAHTDGATDLTGQFGYDGAVRHSDGHLIVAKQSTRDVAAGTHQVFDITSTSTITTKTAIAASTDDHYYPQVFIDQSTNAIYVTYNGKRDGSEVLDTTTKVYYTTSTDGGATWSAGDTAYMEGAAGIVQQVWTPLSGPRFYAVWRVGTTLLGNKVNSIGGQLVGGPTIASTAAFGYTETLIAEEDGGANTENATLAGRSAVGQTISGHAGLVTSVSLKLQRIGTPTDAMYLELRESSRDGLLLGTSAQVSAAGLSTTATWFNFAFPPFLITAGTTYWIEIYLTRVSGDASNYWGINNDTAGTYAGGARQSDTTPQTGDLAFRLYTGTSHTVALAGGAGDQAVTGAFVTSTSVVYSPQTVSPGAVTLTGATRGSTAQLFTGTASTAAGAQAVTGPTLASGAAVTAGTVAPGAVTTTGATIGSGAQTFSGSVSPGAVTVTGTTLTSGAVVRAGTVTTLTAVSGATRSSTATLTAGSVTTTTPVTGATLGSSLVLRAGTVTTTTSVTGTTLASTLALFPGTVSTTAAGAIDGAVILNSAQLFPGLVTPGAVLVTGATRGTSAQVFPGAVAAAAVAVVTDEPFAWLM